MNGRGVRIPTPSWHGSEPPIEITTRANEFHGLVNVHVALIESVQNGEGGEGAIGESRIYLTPLIPNERAIGQLKSTHIGSYQMCILNSREFTKEG